MPLVLCLLLALHDSAAVERRVDSLMAKMSIEQKVELIGGIDDMFIKSLPSIGWPRLKMSDGPMGVRTWGPTTGYAIGIGLAASWDPGLAQVVGQHIGRDARARGVHILLGPGVNIYRAPMNGRNFEYMGEDPYLAARTAVGYIRGVQSQGVVATIKHYAGNNEEYDRHNISSDISEQALREIYLPTFEAAVREAHVGAIMDSYNLLNGVHATQNAWLNDSVAKRDWGFDGVIMSDWWATYDGVAAANGGLDLEMPSGQFMNPKTLLPAIQNGQVSVATIDDKVRRILRLAIRFGFLDHAQTDVAIPRYGPDDRAVALQTAREGMVLLKNEGGILPLNPTRVRTIAVIGPDAWPARPSGGGSAQIEAFDPVSILSGVSEYGHAHHIKVLYARGIPTDTDIVSTTRMRLHQEIFDNDSMSGAPIDTGSVDNLPPDGMTPLPRNARGVRWTGTYIPKTTGPYLVIVRAYDGYRLKVNDDVAVDQPAAEGASMKWAVVNMTAGQPAQVQLALVPRSQSPRAILGIRALDSLVSPEAVQIAKQADAVVLSVGFDPSNESEGSDRTFSLPWGQDLLINTIAAANPHTVVTLTAGGAVATEGWLSHVPALLDTWYPGQEGGTAVAEALFGVTNPEGHLPISFDRRWEENPTHNNYYATKGHVNYAEGVFVGYRFYTGESTKPLYPFGYGLSYTSFAFKNLAVNDQHTVSFDVTNTGTRAGATVAQVYVGDPSAHIKRPTKELKGFEKVRLAPGETKHISVTLNARAFSYWDHGWHVDPGQFVIYVGDSSEHTPLSATLNVGPEESAGRAPRRQ
ncbi:MAG TPA: glycoside hydrolase family 3 C-terminal domain-containing protein [Gemmatimonadaceae bacterium]|nr:glycoside hydrolase family 3 C-terminal domain-containing protein [Gemmatimonadaceae bacterium]